MDLPPPLPNYTVTEVNNDFRKKEPPIYKGMALTLKLHLSK